MDLPQDMVLCYNGVELALASCISWTFYAEYYVNWTVHVSGNVLTGG